jgi:hypothetical protein
VAQLGARLDGIEEVVGSNPIGSTILIGLFSVALRFPSFFPLRVCLRRAVISFGQFTQSICGVGLGVQP